MACIAFIAATSWLVGGATIAPAMHAVAKPADFHARDVRIAGDKRDIAAWQIDVDAGSPVVLLLHSVRASRLDMVRRARLLSSNGYSVVMIDLQAHGETPGDAITFGWRESSDVRAALAWIRREMPGRRVGIVGVSLGGASALLGPQPLGIDALVLEAVYPRITDATEDRIRIHVGPLAPMVAPLLLWQLDLRLGIRPSDLAPIRGIALVGAPVLVAAGSRDEHTTLVETREMFARAREPKELWIVEGAQHEDLLAFDPAAYERHVLAFLDHYLRQAKRGRD
jgi:alpha-beta hydrolase superfamily lysophospholipase